MLVAASVALVAAAVGAAAVGFSGNLSTLNPIGSPGHPPAADQYSTPPSISGISPTEGTTGTVITITGTAFSGVTSVTINGTAASAFTVVTDTTITATVAAGTGAVGHVSVTKPAGSDSSSDVFYYASAAPTNTTAPSITGTRNLNGAALALVGNALTATQGTWSGDPTSFTFQWKDCDSSYASCVNISGATSNTYTLQSSDLGHTVKVFVTEHNGAGNATASNSQFDLRGNVGAPNPTSDNASISGTPEVGTALTANNGSWDGQGGVGAITFSYQWFRCGASAPTGIGDCPTSLGTGSTYTPVLADHGDFLALHVSGSNAQGSNGWSLLTFTQTAVDGPTVSSFNPTSGTAGSSVTITGAHFTAQSVVKFNGVNAASSIVNGAGTSITAIVPSGATSGPISVTTNIGTGTSASSFTVLSTPGITSFSPTAGGTGTTVTITGSNFFGATSVKFSNTTTTDVSVSGDGTQITTHVPTGATTGKLTVTTPAGSATSSAVFTIQAVPKVTKFLPISGVAGNTITLTGSNFTGVTDVSFHGTAALFNFISATSITAIVPSGATTGPITVTTGAGTGSSTTDFVIQQTPVITSFTPGAQQPAGTVTVTGTNFVGITSVQLGSVTLATAAVKVLSSTQLTLTVPAFSASIVNGGDYQIQITNLAGTGNSGTSLLHVATLSLPPAFTIDVSTGHPASADFGADTFPATTVTLTPTSGSFADFGVTSVLFGAKADPTFALGTGPDAGKIIAHVPAGALTGAIKVVNAKGTTTGPNFTVEQPPSIASVTPTSGAPGKQITLSGFNLLRAGHATSVKFGTSAAIPSSSFDVFTASQIKVDVPADATDGAIQVEVAGVGSGASATLFNRVTGPTISGISPDVGKAGTVVTITGTGFSGGATPTVKFGPTLNGTSVKVLDDSHLTAAAPTFSGSLPASVDIKVINDAGQSNTLAGAFTYVAAPSGVSLNPTHGPANSQMTTLVTISGSNFDGATSVMFGAKAATILNIDTSTPTNTITVFAPIGATTGGVKVTTPAGSNAALPTFTVDPPPTLSSFAPAPPAGVSLGGPFTITGTNFRIGVTSSHVQDVTVNGTHLTEGNGTDPGTYKINSATSIAATLPNSGVTTGPIVVINPDTGSATSKLNLVVRGNPQIDSFSPGSGKVGDKITLTGSNLAGGGLIVTFNGTSASSVVVSSNTSVIATVPTGASTGPITVTRTGFTPDSGNTSTTDFIVAQKPTLSSFDPSSGPGSVQATTVVDIQGDHFSGSTGVLFNGKASPFVVVNDDSDITALVPVGATTGKLTVVNPAGNAVSSGLFTVDGPPVVTSMTPTTGAAGDVVTIGGKNLVGEMGGSADPAGTYVDFHGFFGAVIDSITSTQIQVEVPDGAVTGPLLVTDTWGQSAVTPLFTVVNAPSIDNSSSGFFNEFTGLPSGRRGQPVVIYGFGFTGTTSVRFNGTAAPYQVVADWEIIASVPAGATTGPITVTNAAGTSSTAPRNFTILP